LPTRSAEAIESRCSIKASNAADSQDEAEKVNGWSDLPVWLPSQGDYAGFHRRSNQAALA
jgi:hypothetical protein